MRVGPPAPAVRCRRQTTASCCSQKRWSEHCSKRRDLIPSGMIWRGERKRTADDVSKYQRINGETDGLFAAITVPEPSSLILFGAKISARVFRCGGEWPWHQVCRGGQFPNHAPIGTRTAMMASGKATSTIRVGRRAPGVDGATNLALVARPPVLM